MYIETSSPRKQGDNAKLNSPKLQFRGSMCLKFYYHMYGANIAKLNVIINGKNVFTASGDKGNKWLVAAIDISLSGKHEVRDIIMPFGRCIVYSNCNIWVFFYGTRGQPQHMVLFFLFLRTRHLFDLSNTYMHDSSLYYVKLYLEFTLHYDVICYKTHFTSCKRKHFFVRSYVYVPAFR